MSHPNPQAEYGENEIGNVLGKEEIQAAINTLERGNGNKYDPVMWLVKEGGRAYEVTIRRVF